ncbi:hypothetical protein PIB30_090456 [Stylosanthes scabra]|uniref:Uncharacterized protein n=1 Tax=Stylosanthes scabra TaxID=79078 RepID=A0ABU6ZSZ8_9FABA|nr:hypothetical protein [Stylosanthes scabra]
MRDAQKGTESQLNHLAELLQKIANQSPVNLQAQAQSSAPSPLPSQPLPNPKGGINTVQVEIDNEGENEAEDEEGENDWLDELLKELANSDESDDEEEDENIEEESEEESDDEEEESELVEEEDINDWDKGNIFFINTLFKEKKSEEEIPIKYIPSNASTKTSEEKNLALQMGNAEVRKESPGRKAKIRRKPRGRVSNKKGTRDAPTQSKVKKKKVSLNTEKEKEKKKKEPDEGSTKKKRTLKCLSFDGLLGKLKVLKDVLRRNKNVDAHMLKNNSKWK